MANRRRPSSDDAASRSPKSTGPSERRAPRRHRRSRRVATVRWLHLFEQEGFVLPWRSTSSLRVGAAAFACRIRRVGVSECAEQLDGLCTTCCSFASLAAHSLSFDFAGKSWQGTGLLIQGLSPGAKVLGSALGSEALGSSHQRWQRYDEDKASETVLRSVLAASAQPAAEPKYDHVAVNMQEGGRTLGWYHCSVQRTTLRGCLMLPAQRPPCLRMFSASRVSPSAR